MAINNRASSLGPQVEIANAEFEKLIVYLNEAVADIKFSQEKQVRPARSQK
ncbi:hypothetical protein D3C87_2186630 [compost metagenome]